MRDIIAISETKINENTTANLNIPGYAFVNINSKTQVKEYKAYSNKLNRIIHAAKKNYFSPCVFYTFFVQFKVQVYASIN